MKRILILHTGGTITMQLHDQERDGRSSHPGDADSRRRNVNRVREISPDTEDDLRRDTEHAGGRDHGHPDQDDGPQFNLDFFDQQIPGLREIADVESETLFLEDSSEVTPEHWKKLALALEKHHSSYDGFVVLHGTDTMAYTASALSFCLKQLDKPVVFTGSQVPLSNRRTDARRNLINAVELATLHVPEVTICFNDKVYRGNRSTKISIGDFDAFASPNHPLIAEFGLRLQIHARYRPVSRPFHAEPLFHTGVRLIRLFPGMDFRGLIPPDTELVKAIIIEAYGSGNMPVRHVGDFLNALEDYAAQGGIVVVTSQALYDEVDLEKYEGGRRALSLGAISAGDMTIEASITKLMYLIGRYQDAAVVRDHFQRNLAGERSDR